MAGDYLAVFGVFNGNHISGFGCTATAAATAAAGGGTTGVLLRYGYSSSSAVQTICNGIGLIIFCIICRESQCSFLFRSRTGGHGFDGIICLNQDTGIRQVYASDCKFHRTAGGGKCFCFGGENSHFRGAVDYSDGHGVRGNAATLCCYGIRTNRRNGKYAILINRYAFICTGPCQSGNRCPICAILVFIGNLKRGKINCMLKFIVNCKHFRNCNRCQFSCGKSGYFIPIRENLSCFCAYMEGAFFCKGNLVIFNCNAVSG